MRISIIIPVFNEERTVLEVLQKVLKLPLNKEVIVIDDGSTDRTSLLLREIERSWGYTNLKILFHDRNKGKGSAIKTALEIASGDVICVQDADLEYEPSQLIELLKYFEDSSIEVVYGSRFLKNNPVIYRTFYWGNKLLTFMINLLYGAKYTDAYTCYKLIRRDVMKNLNLESNGFEIEAEISVKLAKSKKKVIEVPISYSPRKREEGKKIGLKDALKGILTVLKFRFRLKEG